MSIIQGNAHTSAGGGYQISRSLRFNSADSAYLTRTFSSGNRKTWTWSAWVKRSGLGTEQFLFANYNATVGGAAGIRFEPDNTLLFYNFVGAFQVQRATSQVFRDTSAWYHIVVVLDTTQATAANRAKLYINGVQVTAFSATTDPTQNYDGVINYNDQHEIGALFVSSASSLFNGYMTEINFIDGQALTPSSFGETDSNTGVWKPKAYTGTYGTNGFYLNFSDNSGTTSTTLGKDYSGNGNNWTPNNFSVTAGAGNDSLVDSPTSYGTDTGVGGEVRGNYATLNALQDSATLANGNLDATSLSSFSGRKATMQFPTTGKWYWETTVSNTSTTAGNWFIFGMVTNSFALTSATVGFANAISFGDRNDSASGVFNETTTVFQSASINFATNDILQCAYDADSGKFWFGKNNSWYDSSGTTTGNPATGSNQTLTASAKEWFPFFQGNNTSSVANLNFGQRAFAYTAPSGFKALCTQNLPTPTIGATSTTQANDYMNVVLYTGTGSSLGVTGVGFQPDFVWIKGRSGATDHGLYDAVRGVQKQLESNTTTVETTETTGLTAFGTDGFTVGALAQLNTSSATYVAWNWNGGGSNATNTNGTITSTVRANTTAGFSIVTYTGTSANATVGHGLGAAPSMIIIHARTGAVRVWPVYHVSRGPGGYGYLNQTNAWNTDTTGFNNTNPTSTVFSLGNNTDLNDGSNFVAYCFAPVAGYSAFGSYTGNDSADGPFVFCGFRPRWIIFKNTTNAGSWVIFDTARDTYNPEQNYLFANQSTAENGFGSVVPQVDYLSNGFKIRANNANAWMGNQSGSTFIYAAFAESPFKFSLAR